MALFGGHAFDPYHNLRDPSVGGLFRLFARASDGLMKMQIVKIGFGREP